MKILLVADGRSPITRQWLNTITRLGYSVSLVSTFPCEPLPGVVNQITIPVAFSHLAGTQVAGSTSRVKKRDGLVRKARKQLMHARYWLGPLTLPSAGKKFVEIVNTWQPDMVHALRIPYEGMLASCTPPGIPLIVTIWGNDLTLHTSGSASMQRWTRKTLQRADGLLADAGRDLRLAVQWGYDKNKPGLVVPGSGGIDIKEITSITNTGEVNRWLNETGFNIINPRGLRPGYMNTEGFFEAIPQVLERIPGVNFLCPAMQGQEEALKYVRRFKLENAVRLLPYVTQAELWQLFKTCEVTVSISTHDGTPNTLLEAMACGCFPVAGDLESLRDWITPGINGLLVDSGNSQDIARAIITALENSAMRENARLINLQLVIDKASREVVQNQIQSFYQKFFRG